MLPNYVFMSARENLKGNKKYKIQNLRQYPLIVIRNLIKNALARPSYFDLKNV